MKLTAVLVLSLAALACADTSYQNFQTYTDHANQASSNYYDHRPARRSSKGVIGFIQRLFNPIRRQDLSGASSALPLVGAALLVGAAVIGVSFYASVYNNSGRGLDTDEWEVDHSVWMSQLQKDFEDSWSQE
ncbi:hypothetical protein FJT64_011615 [Amphibalanus amphitrite]|uniref:Uncharacterized protein n=1 Tax=Amphibalanus amphitrite TaxID=1232801 RepID=A0A6A4V8V6_AMPAM|nr:uncharacterized protein LOC122375593 [Amphibalanus amphitrite]XP_043211030.1 uncharacterized protein LOC122375593 [Amphibalanus amphitrite]KAF0290175.1 hypothetical protein FJT64_011615 [Amphibalanus amphitrite]